MKGREDYDCGRYRYWSWRAWDADRPTLGWILLRPAEGSRSVLSKLMHYSDHHGYGSVSVCYLFCARADPFKLLLAMRDPFGPECRNVLFDRMSAVDRFGCAWGDAGLLRSSASLVLSDPRWGSLSGRAFRVGLTRNHQPSSVFAKNRGMVPYSTPRVSD